jgi:protein involved in polysaccharide export with SLBB domain
VRAEGCTEDELAKTINKAYAEAKVPAPGSIVVRAMASAPAPATQVAASEPANTFKPGDRLTIHFGYEDPDLRSTHELTVSEAGIIRLPLLGELKAQGQTAQELADAVARAATNFDAGPGTFTVTSKTNRSLTASATVPLPATQPAASSLAKKEDAVSPSGGATTEPVASKVATSGLAGSGLAGSSTQPDGSAGPTTSASPGPRVDVVIVVQNEAEASGVPTSESLNIAPTISPATAPTAAPASAPATAP